MKPLKSFFRLVTFDVTNTLLKFKLSVGEQYTKVGHIYGIQREPDQITESFLKHWKLMNETYPNFGYNLGISSYVWWRKLVEKTFYIQNNQLTNKELDDLSNHLYNIYERNVCWEVVPGAFSLLECLKKANIKIGVISNFDERLNSVLCANNLGNCFDFVLASYLVGIAKPSKEIFDLALKQSSVTGMESLHVGDNIKLDYLAAKNAGWNAVLIFDKSKTEKLHNDVVPTDVIRDISELKSCVFDISPS